MELIFGQRGAKRGDGGLEPGPDEGNHIHIAFGDNDALGLQRRRPRGVEIVK